MSAELQELIASQGDVRLAAERSKMSVPQLTSHLLDSPQELQAAIRSSMSLQLLDLLANVRVALISALGEMSPKEMTNLLAQLMTGFNELWADPVQNNILAFPVVNGDSTPARNRLEGRLAQLATAAEGD